MKEKFTVRQRVKAVIALVIVFAMILATNMMDNNHFAFVRESFESIYKDRVVVNDYIFRLSRLVEGKRAIVNNVAQNGNYNVDMATYDSINTLVEKYAETKFSTKEELHFDAFNKKLADLRKFEKELTDSSDVEASDRQSKKLNALLSAMLDDLQILSEIQLSESKKLFDSANKLIHNSYLISRVEIAFLIIIGSLILTLITIRQPSVK
ncbi:MAG: MCP four helix bundle domain-containing protein [Cyclobacteriaceae bacterium]